MSWAEVMKINDNVTKPLNEQLRDLKFQPIRVITTTGTYTPEKTGLYKIICIGAGGGSTRNSAGSSSVSSVYANSGGAGGVAIKTIRLTSGTAYSVTVSTTASFGTELTATAGETPDSGSGSLGKDVQAAGGIASGGDYNYTGGKGNDSDSITSLGETIRGGDVGVFISDLYQQNYLWETTSNDVGVMRPYGASILGYGGGACTTQYKTSGGAYTGLQLSGLPAAVIIIPIEMEE